jgi:hypothetical protein
MLASNVEGVNRQHRNCTVLGVAMSWLNGIEREREKYQARLLQAWSRCDHMVQRLLIDMAEKRWGRKWLGLAANYTLHCTKPKDWQIRGRSDVFGYEYWQVNLEFVDNQFRLRVGAEHTTDLSENGLIPLLLRAFRTGPDDHRELWTLTWSG